MIAMADNDFDEAVEATCREMFYRAIDQAISAEVRTIIQFAQDEIILPDDGGKYAGEAFDLDRQPYVRLLWQELQKGIWAEIYIVGPSQSGKTLSAFIIPILYAIAELRKNVIVLVPIDDMKQDKWQDDILPVMMASPQLRQLLPDKYIRKPDARVGASVAFANGASLRFMTAGGSDVSKAGKTGSHVYATEAAALSSKRSTSEETDTLGQIRARLKGQSKFDDDGAVNSDRLLMVEGTVTVEHDLPWRAREQTSKSEIRCKCPHCKTYVAIEREHLGGYEEAKDELEAGQLGVWFCPECGEAIDEQQRREMNQACVLVHSGQTVDKRGKVSGPVPRTTSLWVRWSGFNNLFLQTADFAADEWLLSKLEPESTAYDDKHRELSQFNWARPYKIKYLEARPLQKEMITQRQDVLTFGVVPGNAQFVVAGVDVGRYVCHYLILVGRADGTLHIVTFGREKTSLERGMDQKLIERHEAGAIGDCLDVIMQRINGGLYQVGCEALRSCDLTLIDSKYFTRAVIDAVRRWGGGVGLSSSLYALQGQGESIYQGRRYQDRRRSKRSSIRKTGDRYRIIRDDVHRMNLFVLDVDDAKTKVQACLRVKPGRPGAMTVPQGVPSSMLDRLARHLSAEWRKVWKDSGGKIQQKFDQSGANHHLDCCGYAYKGLTHLGWRIPNTSEVATIEKKIILPPWLANAATSN